MSKSKLKESIIADFDHNIIPKLEAVGLKVFKLNSGQYRIKGYKDLQLTYYPIKGSLQVQDANKEGHGDWHKGHKGENMLDAIYNRMKGSKPIPMTKNIQDDKDVLNVVNSMFIEVLGNDSFNKWEEVMNEYLQIIKI